MALSRTQVDKLGERLKAGSTLEEDLRLLTEYRRSFSSMYSEVVSGVEALGHRPTGRRAKSTTAIVQKLQRESVRLTQIQDIAGCRVIVAGLDDQDELCQRAAARFPGTLIYDRRERPSHGYRAVHLVVRGEDRAVEVQIRTAWQHYWAEFSEQMAFAIDPEIKYGKGPAGAVNQLYQWSDAISAWDTMRDALRSGRVTLAERAAAGQVQRRVLVERDASQKLLFELLRQKSRLGR